MSAPRYEPTPWPGRPGRALFVLFFLATLCGGAHAQQQTPADPAAPTERAAPAGAAAPAERLRLVFSEVEILKGVEPGFSNGVMELTGTVASQSARDVAESIAAGLDGVLYVENLVEVVPPDSAVDEGGEPALGDSAALADERLQGQLTSILSQVETLRGIRVTVQAGVVRLDGEALTRESADRAVELASDLDGVVFVDDRIEISKSILRRLEPAIDGVFEDLREAIATIPLLVLAVLAMFLAWLVARRARDSDRLFRFLGSKVLLRNLLQQTAYVAILLGGLVLALTILDATALIGAVLGAAGVVGLAFGFAFRDIIENYLAGVLMALRQPFTSQDFVEIDGSSGTIIRMTASETVMMTSDGNHLRLPNSTVFKGKVLNFTRNPLRRFTVAVGVGVDSDLVEAQELGLSVLNEMKGVVDDPGPSTRIVKLGDSNVSVEFYGWVDQREASFIKVSSQAMRLVKGRLEEAGIDLPEPIYRVHLSGGAGLSEGSEKDASGPPRRPKPPTDASEDIDVSPTNDIAEQVEREIRAGEEEDLLSDDGEPEQARNRDDA